MSMVHCSTLGPARSTRGAASLLNPLAQRAIPDTAAAAAVLLEELGAQLLVHTTAPGLERVG